MMMHGSTPWMGVAFSHLGTAELPGAANSPTILGWAEALGVPYAADEVPWCGLFVGVCLAVSGFGGNIPKRLLGARQWLRFGNPTEPALGATLVFWRGSITGWQGHVGFYWGETATHYAVLGGNQSNKVSIARIDKERLLGARWPTGAPIPRDAVRRRVDGKNMPISEGEA